MVPVQALSVFNILDQGVKTQTLSYIYQDIYVSLFSLILFVRMYFIYLLFSGFQMLGQRWNSETPGSVSYLPHHFLPGGVLCTDWYLCRHRTKNLHAHSLPGECTGRVRTIPRGISTSPAQKYQPTLAHFSRHVKTDHGDAFHCDVGLHCECHSTPRVIRYFLREPFVRLFDDTTRWPVLLHVYLVLFHQQRH